MFFNKTRKEFETLLQLGSYRVLWGGVKVEKPCIEYISVCA